MALAAWLAACAGPRPWDTPIRVSEVDEDADPARRASMDWVVRGLDEEPARPQVATGRYERAIQVDPTNPYAYLALARHHARSDPDRALEYLDQAEALLESEDALSPRVDPHLLGIRGTALRARGDVVEGDALLAEARALAPEEWGDGRLSPEELR